MFVEENTIRLMLHATSQPSADLSEYAMLFDDRCKKGELRSEIGT